MKKEILRKIFHIFSILFLLIPLHFFGKYFITTLMIFMLIIFYPISKYKVKNRFTFLFWKLLNYIEREKNMEILPARQAFSLAISLIFVSIFFDEKILSISIISIAVFDGIATITGKYFGKVKLFGKKTLEGTLGGFIANSFALYIFLSDFWVSVLISIFVATVEIYSSDDDIFTDDNFTIPIATAFFSWFLFLYLKGLGIYP
ncbi:MAG: hypothetical protein D6834_00910 [Aquificota bacterium]|nr:MAG: hypothetical protein D6834_00910 [Aquificota bacterium]